MNKVLGSHVPEYLIVAAIALVAVLALMRRIDTVSVGFLVAGAAFLVFAGQVNVITSRYYLPTITLAGLAVVRLTAQLRNIRIDALAAAAFLVVATAHVRDSRDEVDHWVRGERQQERIVVQVDSAGSEPEDAP